MAEDAHTLVLPELHRRMVSVLPRWSTIVLISCCLLATGCTALRESAPDSLAALIDRAVPPPQVAGLDFDSIEALGVHGSCDMLAEMWRQNRSVARRELEGRLLPTCEADVQAALARQREAQRLDGLIEEAWQALLARREQQRLLAERRQLEEDLRRRQMQKQQAREEQIKQQLATRQSRIESLAVTLKAAAVHQALAELSVQDKSLAYSAGQISERSLSNFLACVEIAYPNKGYKIRRDGRRLVVIAEKAALPRGRMPIELRFTENEGFWLLTFLKVAEITASNAQDRFILAQNLVAQSCYGEDGLL
jgi:hypothetical protein